MQQIFDAFSLTKSHHFMDKNYWDKVETIVDKALSLSKAERETYVKKLCGDDQKLHFEVTILLDSIIDSEGWLENPDDYRQALYEDISDGSVLSGQRDLIGQDIGSYTIIDELGQGGMGSVYLAKRSDGAFNHSVAIKITKQEKASDENIRRFKLEQKILAELNHPGIAKLFDGGVTHEDYPYFIMEYVDGIPIDKYCKKNKCTIADRITLFKQVLKAVRHAHENLIIHRDLKPGNILVDETGKVTILDFGISKILQDDTGIVLDQTQTGTILLTPRYAAPEQILQSSATTATDIYALGIIFYQLISDCYPYELDELSRYKMEQAILETSPPKPSTKVSSPAKSKLILGDLDAITLKAIRKEPNQRYRTVNNFLEDINRYEQGMPVLAQAGTTAYRFKKYIKRNKQAISIAAFFFVCVMALTTIYTYQLNEQKKTAQSETQKALEVKKILVSLFEANDPILGGSAPITLQEILQKGTEQLLNKKIKPDVRIELLLTLGKIYENISNFDQAKKLGEKSLKLSIDNFGSHSVYTARSYLMIGKIEHDFGHYQKGKNYFLKAQKVLIDKLAPNDALFADLYEDIGYSEERLNHNDNAWKYFKKSLKIVKQQSRIDSTSYIAELRNAARGYYRNEKTEKGDSLLSLALETSKKFNGKNDIVTASVMNDLGLYSMTHAKYDKAKKYFVASIKIKEAVYGQKGHSNYSATLNNLAVLENTLGNFSAAESLYKRTLKMDIGLFGENHPNVAMSKEHLAKIYLKTGQYKLAKKLMDETLKIYRKVYEPSHPALGYSYETYARVLYSLKKYNKSDFYFKKSDSIITKIAPNDKRSFADLYKEMGENYLKMKKYMHAVKKLKEAITNYYEIKPRYYAYMREAAECRIHLAQSYMGLGKSVRAKSVLANLKADMDTLDALSNYSKIQRMYAKTIKNI